jgi:hypothetical protein
MEPQTDTEQIRNPEAQAKTDAAIAKLNNLFTGKSADDPKDLMVEVAQDTFDCYVASLKTQEAERKFLQQPDPYIKDNLKKELARQQVIEEKAQEKIHDGSYRPKYYEKWKKLNSSLKEVADSYIDVHKDQGTRTRQAIEHLANSLAPIMPRADLSIPKSPSLSSEKPKKWQVWKKR